VNKKPLIKNKTRILRPNEYRLITQGRKTHHRIFLDVLLFTGMRYVECRRFQSNPDWFDGDFIFLPESAIKKKKRKQLTRYIRLNALGKQIIPFFLDLEKKLPSNQCFGENLRRWALSVGLEPVGLCVKTFRKTWESWLMYYYPQHSLQIALSQGHTNVTSLQYYLNLAFTDEDRKNMADFVGGWI